MIHSQFYRKKGNLLLEFVLTFPFYVLMSFMVIDLLLMGIHKIKLDSMCYEAARHAVLVRNSSLSELNRLYGRHLQERIKNPFETSVSITPLHEDAAIDTGRKPSRVEKVEFRIRESWTPFTPFLAVLSPILPFHLHSESAHVRLVTAL